MNNLTSYVVRALQSLSSTYLPDELAYLALTQKVEHTIRDSLAFTLHQELQSQPEFLVCREWHRTDIAIVQGTLPRLLLEAKAIYTFDILKSGAQHNYPDQLNRDIDKSLASKPGEGNQEPEVLALLLATHLYDPPTQPYKEAVKYFGDLIRYATEANTIEAANTAVQQRVALPMIDHGEIPAGNVFGIRVSVAYWLFRAP